MRLNAAMIAAFALAACGRNAETPAPAPEPSTPEFQEVAAADSFGAPGERVMDVAFWSHPAVAFESLLIAATRDKVSAYRLETGEARFEISGGAERIDVFYAGEGQKAVGYLLASGDGADRLYAIDQDGSGFKQLSIATSGGLAREHCLGNGASPELYELTADLVSMRSVRIVANGAEFSSPSSIADVSGAIACSVNPLANEVIVTSEDGSIRRVDPSSGAIFSLALPQDLKPIAAALATGRNETDETVAQIVLLDAGGAMLRLFDSKDGHAIGAVRVKATFDLEAVETATRIKIGSANYGGVYRDGALAIVTEGDGAPVRLVPWNGVMGALSIPVAAVVDPRIPGGESAEDSVISIEVIEP